MLLSTFLFTRFFNIILEPELQHPVQGEHLRRGGGGRGRGGGEQGAPRKSHRGESVYIKPISKGHSNEPDFLSYSYPIRHLGDHKLMFRYF